MTAEPDGRREAYEEIRDSAISAIRMYPDLRTADQVYAAFERARAAGASRDGGDVMHTDGKDGPIYGKFRVERTDGRSAQGEKHDGCDYFVLDVTHDPYALPALAAYADACRERFPQLAASIGDRWLSQQPRAQARTEGEGE